MVKPSLKTTSFKHHPMYIQKSLHVDGPFYGPKPMYQRAEVIPGGNCEVAADWASDDTTWDITTPEDGRVGTNCLLMNQNGAASSDGSIYLRLDGPIDLSWAKFIGFWYKGKNDEETYATDNIYFYIFTKYGNYAYANRARSITPIATYTTETTAVWRYAEIDIGDLDIATGYEGDKLDEVWGIGFCSHALTDGQTMAIDQIEFYTVGTGLGPARGLIMSAPLKDGIHAERGYGLRWDPNSGRIDKSTVTTEYAFAGICTGNPTRTRLSQDVPAIPTTTIWVVDASLLREGNASINDDDNALEENLVITAVNRIEKKVTLETAPSSSFTVAGNAYICMRGDEEGNTRVDFIVNGIVNVKAAEIVQQGWGAKCSAAGGPSFTVVEVDAGEEGKTIGKCMETCADKEDFAIALLTDAETA